MTCLFVLPGIVIFCFAMIAPAILAVFYSFFDWAKINEPSFVGFTYYSRVVKDPVFWLALRNNLTFAVLTLIGQLGIGYTAAFILKSRLSKMKRLHRTAMFFPCIISSVVMSYLWILIYSKEYGVINYILRAIGLGQYAIAWLGLPDTVVPSLAVPLIWQWFGLYMVIFMGALETIPIEINESAELDGASAIKRVLYIDIPLTFNTIKVAVIMCLAGIMKMFDHILVMTEGGPGNSSTVLAYYAYKVSFKFFELGYGNTISVGIVVFSLAITFVARRLMGIGSRHYE